MFDLPCNPIQPPYKDEQPLLVIVVDTEEEFDWSNPHARENTSVTSLAAQSRAQAIFDARGAAPTYVVDYPVAKSSLAGDTLVPWASAGRCLIGAHLHPWVNPPFEENVSAQNSYPGNLPVELERKKLEALTTAIEGTFGRRPDIYKAGRYGLGANSGSILEALEYRIDMSVVPHSDFSGDGGPNFSVFDIWPFWFGDQQTILEIPLSCGFHGLMRRHGSRIYQAITGPIGLCMHLPGIFARAGLLERIRLTPEGIDLAANKRLTLSLLGQGCRLFTFAYHSPSLAPGMTPYVRDRSDLERFLDDIKAYLDFFLEDLGGRVITPYQAYDWVVQQSPSRPPKAASE